MRHIILAFILCGIFFLLPIQIYIIGNDNGIGIQGAVYRYQISGYGNSLIPITSDMQYVLNGIYSGKTAVSIITWLLGSVLLACTTIFALIFALDNRSDFFRQIGMALVVVCGCYLISCIAQYGWFLNGPAGISLPGGLFLIVLWMIIINLYPDIFLNTPSVEYRNGQS